MPPHDDAPSQPAAAPGLSAAGGQAVDPAAVTPAIRFEPDGYVLNGPRLMGRQVAGNAFLRAAVAGRGEQPMWAYTPFEKSARAFAELVQELDPGAPARWCRADRLDLLAQLGLLYLPGPDLGQWSRLRLRVGPAAYSLCGVTHTTASHAAMDAITDLLSAPVMPWDALICTSSAVLDTVQVVLEAEAASLRWRFGPEAKLTRPQLPVIPLGVHCADFEIAEDERAAARAALGVAPDEVVALFVGRLSFHAKAHPHPMYVGLQKAAERSGRKLVLIQCGWFASEFIEASIKAGAEHTCPDVRCLYTDGKDADARRRSWAAADLFISLSDNVQETFGLTPVEAMAAGLPVVVTDWDGYKDTVRHGVDGYRIPTWMPPPGAGDRFAMGHQSGVDDYDRYCGFVCQTVSLDLGALSDGLTALASSADLRRSLGEAGRRRAREVFDWPVVYRQYQALWAELARMRRAALADADWVARLRAAPAAPPSRLDPYRSFRHYPTALIAPATRVRLAEGASVAAYQALAGDPLFRYASRALPAVDMVERLFAAMTGERTVAVLAAQLGVKLGPAILCLAPLAKMGLVEFAAPPTA